MTLTPLAEAGPMIQVHALAALAALALGAVQLALPKGTTRHRLLGWIWIGLIATVALGSFGIHEARQFGPFSWIHGISLLTLVLLVIAIAHARAGRIEAHRWTMIGLFAGALVINGGFTLLPGRVMHDVIFGSR